MTGKPPLSARTRTLGALKLLGGATLVGLPLHLLGLPAGMLLGSIFGAALVNQPGLPNYNLPTFHALYATSA